MSEPNVPSEPPRSESPAEDARPTTPPEPDLPEELVPLHEEFGTWWRIEYNPLNRSAPYTARPRFTEGNGRTLRSDTVRLLSCVLDLETPDFDET